MNTIPFSPSRYDATVYFKREKIEKRKEILDVGCGRLFLLNFLVSKKYNGKYFGIDIDPRIPQDFLKLKNAKIKKVDVFHLKTRKKFDLISCLWVLEHIKEDKKALARISKLLSPNGILLLAVPSIWSWPFEFGRHGYHYYSKRKIAEMAKEAKLEIQKDYESGGFLGFIFMLAYNWPRLFLLLPAVFIFKILKNFKLTHDNWEKFSSSLINKTIYRYHNNASFVSFHNRIVKTLVNFDNKAKFLPATYIYLLNKK